MIPCAELKTQTARLREEIMRAVGDVLDSGWFVLGRQLAAFEEEFAAYLGAPHAVGVASGTEAIQLALTAVGVRPGDDVITQANTCVPTICGIVAAGARPVLADVDPATCALDPAGLKRALTPRTRAIVPVHLYGHPCDMDPILEQAAACKLWVVEDCAQAVGAMYRGRKCGTLGHAAAFSFYPTKNLGALGDGGAVTTADDALAAELRMARNYRTHDVGTLIHYPIPIHKQPAYAGLEFQFGSSAFRRCEIPPEGGTPKQFPHAERACAEVLSLPMYPELPLADVDRVAEAVLSFKP